MARFPSIDNTGAFESPEVQDHIKQLVTGSTDGITVDTSVGTRVFVGNTMIYGDTGTREIFNPSTPPEWGGISSGNYISIQRYGNTVFFTLRGYRLGDFAEPYSAPTMLTLPEGFRPGGNQTNVQFVNRDNSSAPYLELTFATSGSVVVDRPTSHNSGRHYGQLVFSTSDNWPISLPGTPR